VATVMPNPGRFSCSVVNCSASGFGRSITIDFSINTEKSGPAMAAVGMPISSAYNTVMPTSA
jgi:hypothetical protein